MNIFERKRQLRQEIREKRNLLTKESILDLSTKVITQFLQTSEYIRAHTIFVYVSYQQEISTLSLIKIACLDKKVVAVPKVISKREMKFLKIKGVEDLKPGFSGILEPDITGDIKEIVVSDKSDIMILPGMLFDLEGNRLGYGGGFYDTYLEKCKMKPIKIGFTYDFQLFKKENISEEFFSNGEFPLEEHDKKMNILITPTRIIYI